MKKIIEEQQRLSGVLSEAPGPGNTLASGDTCRESDKVDPATPAPTSECPIQDKAIKERAPAKSLSIDESYSSRHDEPSTPDSGCHVISPAESPDAERLLKKQRFSMGEAFSNPEVVLTHQILESSLNSYQQAHTIFVPREQSNPTSDYSIRNVDLEQVAGSDM